MVDVLSTLPTHRKLPPGRYGAAGPQTVITLAKVARAAAALIAPATAIAAVAALGADAFGTKLPVGPRHAVGDGLAFVGLGPGRWLVIADDDPERLVERLEGAFGPSASVVDQSGGLVFFEAAGARTDDMLAKLLTIDIAPSAFALDAAATTAIAHIGITLWREDAGARWCFAVGYSFEAAFLRAIAQSAAEYGLTYSG